MNETYDTPQPTPEELSQTYKGYTIDDFRQANGAEIQQLHDERYQEYIDTFVGSMQDNNRDRIEQDFWEFVEDVTVLDRLSKWARHGIPDRNVTREEVLAEMAVYVARRKKQDPNYGEITPEHYTGLTEREMDAAKSLISYVFKYKDPVEYVFIDSTTLYETLRFDHVQVGALIDQGIIRLSSPQSPRPGYYELGKDFYDHFLVKDLPVPEDDNKRSDTHTL